MRRVSEVGRATSRITSFASAPEKSVSALWISWNAHRRTTGLCAAWNVPLHVVRSERSGLLRRVAQAKNTIGLLRRSNPRIVFVQNPSLALTLLAVSVRRVFGYYLVVDAHNEGVRPFARRGRLVRWLTRGLLRSADATIVTNDALTKDVDAAGGRALVLPDRLPEPQVPLKRSPTTEAMPLVAVIASFMPDEPVQEIIAAAAMLPGVRFEFTGDTRRYRHKNIDLPPNVQLGGYLAEKAFWNLLLRATVVCDLTLKPDCLVCGAYEALALAKPMVLSDNPATREIFGPAAVLTNNRPKNIARAIRTAIKKRDRLRANARVLREGYSSPWQAKATATWKAICAGAVAAGRGPA